MRRCRWRSCSRTGRSIGTLCPGARSRIAFSRARAARGSDVDAVGSGERAEADAQQHRVGDQHGRQAGGQPADAEVDDDAERDERDEALRNLAERTGVDDLHSLVAMLIQTDKFGTSIAKAIRAFSDSLRTKRRQRAEQAAQKAAVKLLFPLSCFLFPTLFIALLGPAALQLIDTFNKM